MPSVETAWGGVVEVNSTDIIPELSLYKSEFDNHRQNEWRTIRDYLLVKYSAGK